MGEPRLEVLPRGSYWARAAAGRGGRLPWWWPIGKMLGRPGAWYEPRVFAMDPVIIVLQGKELDARLMAHEYGHHLGHDHPPRFSWDYLFDVMGYGLRIRDRYGVLEASRAWRAARGLP